MSKTKEVRPFGLRDKIGYMCGDLRMISLLSSLVVM